MVRLTATLYMQAKDITFPLHTQRHSVYSNRWGSLPSYVPLPHSNAFLQVEVEVFLCGVSLLLMFMLVGAWQGMKRHA